MISNKRRGTQHLNIRNHRVGMANNTVATRAISRNMHAGKVHKNRKQRRTKDKKLSLGNDGNVNSEENGEAKPSDGAVAADESSANDAVTEELSNGFVVFFFFVFLIIDRVSPLCRYLFFILRCYDNRCWTLCLLFICV